MNINRKIIANKIKSRRSQAAVFVLMGLIILIGAFAIFFVQKAGIEKPVEKEAGKQPEFAGQAELRNYVDNCVKKAVLRGLEIMRLQGGYIEIPPQSDALIAKDKQGRYVSYNKKVEADRNAEGNKLPYWLTADRIAIPSISFMEKELEDYAKKSIDLCANDFKDFQKQGFDVRYKEVGVKVAMGKAVIAIVDFPIIFKKGSISFEENKFEYAVPIDMDLIQKTASELTAIENFNAFLEDHTKNLISLYSGVDQNRLPPLSQSTTNFDCNFVSWSKNSVKGKLKDILAFNMPSLKVKGTDFSQPEDPSSFHGVYSSFVYDLLSEQHPNIEIEFEYDGDWEFLDYDIIPSNGDTLVPERVVGTNIPMLPQICVFKYPFKYTVKYPVLVRITDSDSAEIDPGINAYYDNKGFAFQFPMVAYLCGNQNRACNTGRFSAVVTGYSSDVNSTLLPETLFCNPEQKISDDIIIKTFDSLAGSSLGNVDVGYYCGSYQNDCFIGRTDSSGILKAKFPLCINGQVYFTKDGYSILSQNFTTYGLKEPEFSYSLIPKKSLIVNAKKINVPSLVKDYFENARLTIENSVMDLTNGEKAAIASDTGLFYVYPDPYNRTMQLSSGGHEFNLQLIRAENSISLGFLSINSTVAKGELRKEKITFYVFEDGSIDSILRPDGSLEAELLYSCEKNSDETCNYENCSFEDIDGTNAHDFSNNPKTCEKAVNATIRKEQYQDFVKPIFD